MDKYTIIALIFIALCLIPILYLLFFIGRIIFCIIQERIMKTTILNDSVFGEIKKKGEYDWEGVYDVKLVDKNDKILLMIDANKKGPLESQRELYLSIQDHLTLLYPVIIQKLFDYHEGMGTHEKLQQLLEPTGLNINSDLTWSISFIINLESEGDMGYDVLFDKDMNFIAIEAGD